MKRWFFFPDQRIKISIHGIHIEIVSWNNPRERAFRSVSLIQKTNCVLWNTTVLVHVKIQYRIGREQRGI